MIKLYITNALGFEPYEEYVGEYKTFKECNSAMNNILKTINFKSYYTRFWEDDEGIYIDYGSHVKYFLLKGIKVGELLNETE